MVYLAALPVSELPVRLFRALRWEWRVPYGFRQGLPGNRDAMLNGVTKASPVPVLIHQTMTAFESISSVATPIESAAAAW